MEDGVNYGAAFRARHSGLCRDCGGVIAPGQLMRIRCIGNNKAYVHADCDAVENIRKDEAKDD